MFDCRLARELPAARNKPLIEGLGQHQEADHGQEERIRRRAHEIWEREGRPQGREREHWDQAVQEIEAEGSEAERGPVVPDPTVGAASEPDTGGTRDNGKPTP
ncbi:MAG: DUF2934 domain-containing protein [Mesorhizobium sp.]|nr:MAG: DUF2934 domain-containing protein [Mesorhizobium sp.]